MKLTVKHRLLSILASLSLLVNSFAAPISVLAQEATTEPTPIVEETPAPTVEATPIPSEEPTPTVEVTPSPTTEVTGDASVEASTTESTQETTTTETTLTLPEPDLSSPQEETSAQLNPTLTTDKADYAPTGTVLITGKDFSPNTEYTIEITSDTGNFKFSDTVTSDESGGLFYSYQLDGTYRPDYKVEIKNGDTVVATTTFTDTAIQVDWVQCENDSDNNNIINSPMCNWVSGSLNSNNSVLAEGNTIPPYPPAIPGHVNYRSIFEGLVAGTYELTIKYEFTKGGQVAFDFLTTDYGVTDSNLCEDLPGGFSTSDCNTLVGGSLSTLTFPFEAETVNATLGGGEISLRQSAHDTAFAVFNPRTMKVYGATINSIVNLSRSGSDTGDSEDSVKIIFVKTTGEAEEVLVTWGGHLGIGVPSPTGYGTGNGAGSISGAPFHMALDVLARTTDPIDKNVLSGSRDRSVQPGAILPPGTVTIIKDSQPDGSQDFGFTTIGNGLSSFSLDDDGDSTLSNTKNFTGLEAGSYSITESATTGYTLSNIQCTDPSGGTTTNGATANINLSSGETVICTFTNTQDTGSITVLKNVDNNNDGDVNDLGDVVGATDWTWDIVDGDQNISTGGSRSLATGNYTISEDGKTNYHPIGWSCSNQTSGNGDSFSISLGINEDVTCTFTNARDTGTITIIKNIDWDKSGQIGDHLNDISGATNWFWDIVNGEQNIATGQTRTLPTGNYTVTEDVKTNYNLVNWQCSDQTSGSTNSIPVNLVSNGQDITCTLTNAPDNGSISGHKYHDKSANGIFDGPDNYLDGWTINLTGENFGSAITGNGDWSLGYYEFTNLVPGNYTVCEELQGGWTPISPDPNTNNGCYGVEVTPGQNIVNKDFGNFQNVTLSGYKFEDLNGNGTWDQGELPLDNWTVNLGGTVSDSVVTGFGDWDTGYYEFSNLGPGSYSISETLPVSGDWMQTSSPTAFNFTSLSGGTNVIHLDFGNFEFARVWGYKYNDLNASGDLDIEGVEDRLDGWEINLTGQSPVVTASGGYFEFTGLIAGDYTLSENSSLQTGWTNSLPGTGEYLFTIQSGDVLQFDFANWTKGSLVACKYDENEEPVSDWEMTVTGGDLEGPVSQNTLENGCTTFTLDPGSYSVAEEDNSDWVHHTSPASVDDVVVQSDHTTGPIDFYNARKAEVTIQKFNDLNGNGDNDSDSDPRLEDWHFSVYEGSCEEPGDMVLSGSTNSSGEVTGLLPQGDYCAVEDDDSYTGWINTTDLEVEFSVSPNDTVTILFGNTELGEISGKKFNDLDGDHIRTNTTTDPNLPGWTIRLDLVDSLDAPNCPDGTVNGEYCELVTNSFGNYSFEDLYPGNYIVSEDLQSGWIQTRPNESYGGQGAQADGTYLLTIQSGDAIDDRDFGNQGRGSIQGYKFHDLDRDGQWGEEPTFSGWVIFLDKNDNQTLDEGELWTETENGAYLFENMPAGEYSVCEEIEEGWEQTYPGESLCHNVILEPGEFDEDNNFGNFLPQPSLSSVKTNIGPSEVLVGETAIFQAVIENTGNVTLYNPIVLDIFDTEYVDFDSSSPIDATLILDDIGPDFGDYDIDGDTSEHIGLLGWEVPVNLAPGDTYTITLYFIATAVTPDSEEVVSTNGIVTLVCLEDTEECSEEDTLVTEISRASVDIDDIGISIEKSNDKPSASVGDTVTYTLVVANDGESPVFDVEVTDALPGGFTYVPGSTTINGSSEPDPSISGNNLTWNVGTVISGEPVTIVYQATIASDVASGTYTNLATCQGEVEGLNDQIELFVLYQTDGEFGEPIECNVASSNVGIGRGTDFSGNIPPQVLGAATELPAAGSDTAFLVLAIMALIAGVSLKGTAFVLTHAKLKRRKYAKN